MPMVAPQPDSEKADFQHVSYYRTIAAAQYLQMMHARTGSYVHGLNAVNPNVCMHLHGHSLCCSDLLRTVQRVPIPIKFQ